MNHLTLAALALGGMCGTLIRYALVLSPVHLFTFKINIMLVNMLGSFIAGLFYGITKKYQVDSIYTSLLLYGFCGALTTMSSCVLETYMIMEQSKILLAAVYLTLNVILSFNTLVLGVKLISSLAHP